MKFLKINKFLFEHIKYSYILIVVLTTLLCFIPLVFTFFVAKLFNDFSNNLDVTNNFKMTIFVLILRLIFEIIINFPRSYSLYSKIEYIIRKKYIAYKSNKLPDSLFSKKNLKISANIENIIKKNYVQNYFLLSIKYYLNFFVILLLLILNAAISIYLFIIVIIVITYNIFSKRKIIKLNKSFYEESIEHYNDYSRRKEFLYSYDTLKRGVVNKIISFYENDYIKSRNIYFEKNIKYELLLNHHRFFIGLLSNLGFAILILVNLLFLLFLDSYSISLFATSFISTEILVNLILEQIEYSYSKKNLESILEDFFILDEKDKYITIEKWNSIVIKNSEEEIINIKKNDKILIKGRNGSGKSTLLDIITGMYKDESLDIYIDNVLIFERFMLSNISYLRQKSEFFDLDYNSSGEERFKYIENILKKEDLILLDEPFYNLDETNKKVILNLIKNFETTVIIVLHRDIEIFDNFFNKIIEKNDIKINL